MNVIQRQHIADTLKAARLRRGWTQAHAAEQVGTTDATWSRWEKGQVTPGGCGRLSAGECGKHWEQISLPKGLTSGNDVCMVMDMEATRLPQSGQTAGKESIMDYTNYQLTGDVLADRAAWKAAGSPSDHPYIVDCATRSAGHAVGSPLAIEISDADWATVQRVAPIMQAMSAANIRAMVAE